MTLEADFNIGDSLAERWGFRPNLVVDPSTPVTILADMTSGTPFSITIADPPSFTNPLAHAALFTGEVLMGRDVSSAMSLEGGEWKAASLARWPNADALEVAVEDESGRRVCRRRGPVGSVVIEGTDFPPLPNSPEWLSRSPVRVQHEVSGRLEGDITVLGVGWEDAGGHHVWQFERRSSEGRLSLVEELPPVPEELAGFLPVAISETGTLISFRRGDGYRRDRDSCKSSARTGTVVSAGR